MTQSTITNVVLIIGSLVVTTAIAIVIKMIFYKVKRPNGKRGGIISLHAALAFSIVVCIALITKNWLVITLTCIMAYLIAMGRIDSKQHHAYQVIFGGVLGGLVSMSIFYLYTDKVNFGISKLFNREQQNRDNDDDGDGHSSHRRHDSDDHRHHHSKHKDERDEADKHSDLSLLDIDD